MELMSKRMKCILFLITFTIVLMWLLDNFTHIWGFASKLFSISSPFILGFAIAFILKVPMNFIERNVFEIGIFKKMKTNLKRVLSYLITILIFIGVIFAVLFLVIPELISTIEDLSVKIPTYIDNLRVFIENNLIDKPQVIRWMDNINWPSIENSLINFFKSSGLNWLGSTIGFATSIVGGIITFVLAFVFSIYALLKKEELALQSKKIILAYLPEKFARRIFYIGGLANKIFSNFLSGQLLEAITIGLLFFIAMIIFKFPYALLISLLIGITSFIPLVGAFIGCIVGAFLILVIDVRMAFWFVVMFIVIQQIESNLIYPQIAGKASGLPSIWILVAVTLGGSLMGILGMILFIPIFSLIYSLLRDSVNFRLKRKEIQEL